MTLKCAIGQFIFSKSIPLSAAKRIRDDVMGAFLDKGSNPKLKTSADCIAYANRLSPYAEAYLTTIHLN